MVVVRPLAYMPKSEPRRKFTGHIGSGGTSGPRRRAVTVRSHVRMHSTNSSPIENTVKSTKFGAS